MRWVDEFIARRMLPGLPFLPMAERQEVIAARPINRVPVSLVVLVVLLVGLAIGFKQGVFLRWLAGHMTDGQARLAEVALFVPAAAVLFAMLFRLGAKHMRAGAMAELRARGRCTGCGYDVRATPDRCPECGTPVAGGEGTAAAV